MNLDLISSQNMSSVAALAGISASTGTKRTAEELLNSMAGIMNDQKKPKYENPPSKVIHVRNVPSEITETELIALGVPFGRVSNVLLLKGKGQGFLEMESEDKAAAMIQYYNYSYNTNPTIRGKQVYVQFSRHKELKTDPSQHAPGTSRIIAAGGDFSAANAMAAAGVSTDVQASVTGGNILRAIIEKMYYQITVDILHQIFGTFGTILRIVTFTKNNQFQALVEYGQASEAAVAKLALDGQNIYNGCCTLRIDYSRLSALTVKFNNDKSKDYTRPELPSGPEHQNHMGDLGGLAGLAGSPGAGMLGNPAALLGLLPTAGLLPSHTAFAGGRGAVGLSSPVVLVSNLNEEMVNCDVLFTLFGVYGDVMRVKILFNKKDTALIQFSNGQQAQTAIAHLNSISLYGKDMKVTASKHNSVSLPREGDENNLTKDFSNSPLHRFKKPGSKNFQNIFPPNSTLHLSNIPETVTEEEIKETFACAGTVTEFRFFPKDRRMGLITMATTEEAIDALIKMHNYKITEANHLRVSFAKTRM